MYLKETNDLTVVTQKFRIYYIKWENTLWNGKGGFSMLYVMEPKGDNCLSRTSSVELNNNNGTCDRKLSWSKLETIEEIVDNKESSK